MTEINSAFQNDRMVHSDIDYLSSALSSTIIIHHKFVGFIKCVFFSVITQTCYCCFSELEKKCRCLLACFNARCAIAAHVYDEIHKVKTPGLVLFCFAGVKFIDKMVEPPDTSKGTLLGPKTPGWEQWAYSTLFASEKLSPMMISWGERP